MRELGEVRAVEEREREGKVELTKIMSEERERKGLKGMA